MFESLLASLQLFLQQEVQLLLRGTELGLDIQERIPALWKQALSGNEAVAHSIQRLWQPVSNEAAQIVSLLVEHTEELALVASVKTRVPIGLLYIFRHGRSTEGQLCSWLGGLPISGDGSGRAEERLGHEIPRSYKAFAAVHDGFLWDGLGSVGIKPLDDLYFLSEFMLDLEEPAYDPSGILAFCGDGGGNEQCYDLNTPAGDGDYLTFDWDHETRELLWPMPFWSFLARFIAREMGV